MKIVKDARLILKGQIDSNTYNGLENRIQLFDGLFTTGYRVVEFRIVPSTPQTNHELLAIISVEPRTSVPSVWDFSQNKNVAYAAWGIPITSRFSEYNLIVDGNMAIEDLWLSVYTTTEAEPVNYYIVLEKYTMTDWEGAGVLVDNLSQGGPN